MTQVMGCGAREEAGCDQPADEPLDGRVEPGCDDADLNGSQGGDQQERGDDAARSRATSHGETC